MESPAVKRRKVFPSNCFSDLPLEMTLEVLKLAFGKELRSWLTIRRVCRWFKDVVDSNILYSFGSFVYNDIYTLGEVQLSLPFLQLGYKADSWNRSLSATLQQLRNKVDVGRLYSVDFSGLGETAPDLSILSTVHTVNLSRTRVSDFTALGTIHTLNLASTPISGDLSPLSSVHNLNVSDTRVKDVSCLRRVHTLKLADTLVTDVSMLGEVHDLDLSGTRVTDVSSLGTVHTLRLSNVRYVADFSALGSVHTLDLSCNTIHDVSALASVHTLNLSNCQLCCDISCLKGVPILRKKGSRLVEGTHLEPQKNGSTRKRKHDQYGEFMQQADAEQLKLELLFGQEGTFSDTSSDEEVDFDDELCFSEKT